MKKYFVFILFLFLLSLHAQIPRHAVEFGFVGHFEEIPSIDIKNPAGVSFRYHYILEEMGPGNLEFQAGAQFFSLGSPEHNPEEPINREKKYSLLDGTLAYAINLINPEYNAFQLIAGYAPGVYIFGKTIRFNDHLVAGISGGTNKYRMNFMYHFPLKEQYIGSKYHRLTNTTTSFYFKPAYISLTFMILSGW